MHASALKDGTLPGRVRQIVPETSIPKADKAVLVQFAAGPAAASPVGESGRKYTSTLEGFVLARMTRFAPSVDVAPPCGRSLCAILRERAAGCPEGGT